MAFTLPIPLDTAIITDDVGLTGAALVDTATGDILGFVDLPSDFPSQSESGVVMLDGTIGSPDNQSGSGNGVFGIYDSNLSLIVNAIVGNPGAENVYPIGATSDRTTYFYVLTADDSDNLTVHQVAKTGVTVQSWPLGFTSTANPTACAVNRDNTFFYFKIRSGGVSRIKRLDLGTSAVDEIGTISDTTTTWMGVDTDGNIYVNSNNAGTGTIRKYDSSFVLIDTVADGPAGYTTDQAHFSADDLHLFSWTQKTSGVAHPDFLSAFRKIRLSDLAVISNATDIPTESDSSFITPGESISNSCPLMITGTPGPVTACAIWPVWLNDDGINGETFLVFSGSYLGNGQVLRYDFDGNLVKAYPYDPSEFPNGMMGLAGMLETDACLIKEQEDDGRGMFWLAGHHSPPVGIIQPGVLPFRLTTGEVLTPVVAIPAETEVDETAGFTVIGDNAYPSGNGDPTDQGLPPKPNVVCGDQAMLRSPSPNPCCNSGGRGWIPQYTTSGSIPTSTDPSDEETLTGKDDIEVDVEIQHTRYLSDGTEEPDVLRYAHVDLADTERKEGRLSAAGTIEIASSDGQGNMKSTSASITIFDGPDRPIGSRRSDAERRNFNRDEITIRAQSDRGRALGLSPRYLGRVLAYGDSSGTPTTARLNGVDHLFIEGGSFSPDKTAPQYRYPLSFYTNAPPDVAQKFIPYLYGEKSDEGAVNPLTGEVNARGLCPVTDLGNDFTLGEEWGQVNFLLYANKAVIGLYGSDLGGLGCYGREAVSDGKKPSSTITLTGVGDFSVIPGGGWAQLVLLHPTNGRSEHRITRINIGARSVKVEGEIDATVVNGLCDWFIERIDHVPRRVRIDIASRQGEDVMIPGYTGYVRPTPYEDISCSEGDFRMFNGWVRGPLLTEHRNGGCTLAANLAGIEDQGDGSGDLITEFFTAYAHWWDNQVHQQSAKPTVDIGGGVLGWAQVEADLPQWSDGLTKTMHSSFATAQAQSAAALGGIGLTASAYFSEGISLRDAAQLWNDNGGCYATVEEHGRVKTFLIDPYADTSTWPPIVDVNRVFGSVETPRAVDEQMNQVRGGCDWDPDGQQFREDNIAIISAEAVRRNKGYVKASKHIDGKLLGHPAHFNWVLNRKLAIHQDGPIYVEVEAMDFGLVDYPVGSGVVFTSEDGPGESGYVEHPLVILDRRTNLDGKTCGMLFLDVGTDKLVKPDDQRFIATNDDAEAPIATNDADEAPLAAA